MRRRRHGAVAIGARLRWRPWKSIRTEERVREREREFWRYEFLEGLRGRDVVVLVLWALDCAGSCVLFGHGPRGGNREFGFHG
jgi:hypothetical protein